METNNINKVQQMLQRPESVHRLLEDDKLQAGVPLSHRLTSDEDPHVLLSKLLQQLEALQVTGASEDVVLLETPDDADVDADVIHDEMNNDDTVADEILKELKKVRRQNMVTHCLLTAILVLTVVGQLSEIALISRVRRGLNNPVKAIGGLLLGMVKRRGNETKHKVKEADELHNVPKIKMELPLPHVHIPDFSSVED